MDGSPCLDLQEINSTNSSKLSGNITFCNEEGNNTLILPENNTPPIIITINTIIGGVGTLGNLSVILVFGKEKKFRRKIPNIFIINQSVIDFTSSLVLLLLTYTVTDNYKTSSNGWIGDLECGIWNTKFILWGTLTASSWNMVFLTIERYLELVHPLWHKANFKMKYLYTALVLSWVFGMGITSYAIPVSKLVNGVCIAFGSWPSDQMRQIFGIIITFLTFLVPFIILVFCYSKIVWMLTRRISKGVKFSQTSDNDNKTQGTADPSRDKFELARTNTIKTLLIVGCCYIICWSPNQCLYLVYNLGYTINWNSTFFHFTVVMIFSNSMVNPFIYVFKYKDYQDAMKKFLSCNSVTRDKDGLTSSTITTSSQTINSRI